MSPKVARKIVLVTGASSGFGKACALHLAAKGHKVYGAIRNIADTKQEFETLRMDVNEDNSVKVAVENLLEKEGSIDAVVNNAGISVAGSVEDTSMDEMKLQFETNFFGVLRVIHNVLPYMRRRNTGTIINISSLAGRVAVPYQGGYSGSKHALEGLSDALRMEVKAQGIRIVLVEPGDFPTNLTANRIITAQSRTSPVYKDHFEKTLNVFEHDEANGPHPRRVAKLVASIIANPSPRPRYVVGPLLEKFAIPIKKILPTRLFDLIIMKYYRIS